MSGRNEPTTVSALAPTRGAFCGCLSLSLMFYPCDPCASVVDFAFRCNPSSVWRSFDLSSRPEPPLRQRSGGTCIFATSLVCPSRETCPELAGGTCCLLCHPDRSRRFGDGAEGPAFSSRPSRIRALPRLLLCPDSYPCHPRASMVAFDFCLILIRVHPCKSAANFRAMHPPPPCPNQMASAGVPLVAAITAHPVR